MAIENRLSKHEKLKLIMAQDWWQTNNLNGKLKSVRVSDGPLGLRCLINTDDWENDSIKKSVAYPCYQMLSQTWNLALAKKMGRAIADDCIDFGVDILLGPGVNIKRTPLCGRNFEYFSEDPYVSGVFAKAFIEGVQEGKVGVSLKHFCCNNREFSRYWLSSEVDERTLREIYLKPFEIAVQANPCTVMTSYNLLNGVRMCENAKLYKVLRDEFGFNGVIVSDWEAVQDPRASLHAGLDLEFPYNEEHAREMERHLESDNIDLKCLDESAARIFELAQNNAQQRKLRKIKYSVDERSAISREVEEDGIVLLKNNGVLPLSKGKICVTGTPSQSYYFGGGSSAVIPNKEFVSLDKALNDLGCDAFYSESTGKNYGTLIAMGNLKQACLDSAKSEVTVLTVGTGFGAEVEETDRESIKLSSNDYEAFKYIRKYAKKLVVVVYAGSVVDLSEIDKYADAVVLAGFGGQEVSVAVAKVLCGAVNPSGRLTETYMYSLDDVPSEKSYRDESVMIYEERLDVGYRYFETKSVDVLYPFGYGLSYSDFLYSDLKVYKNQKNVIAEVDIENTSLIDGKEVVQLYVHQNNPTVYRPIRELKAFDKVFIPAKQKVRVRFELDNRAFSYYSETDKCWKMDNDKFTIEICKNSHIVILSDEIELNDL